MSPQNEDLFDSARGSEPRRRLILETDGGARGNPGPAGFGAVVRDAETKEVLAQRADYLGEVTNNVAEYTGLLEGLKTAREIDPDAIVEVRSDSKLVVEQMSGRWKIKHPDMQALAMQARKVFAPERVKYTWVPRAKNKQADRLANEAMDTRTRVEWNVGEQPRSGTAAAVMRGPGSSGPGTSKGACDLRPEADIATHAPANDQLAHLQPRPSGSRVRFDDVEPVTVVLIRHGETEMTQARAYSGAARPGPSLSPKGREQAAAAADVAASVGHSFLPDLYPISKLLSSPLDRAMQTAAIVGKRLGMTVQEAPEFIEADFGVWEGLTAQQIEAKWPGSLYEWHKNPAIEAPGGGESLAGVSGRGIVGLDRLVRQYAGRTVAVCAHVVSIRAAIGAALGVPPEVWGKFRIAPGSVSVVRAWAVGDGELAALLTRTASQPIAPVDSCRPPSKC